MGGDLFIIYDHEWANPNELTVRVKIIPIVNKNFLSAEPTKSAPET